MIKKAYEKPAMKVVMIHQQSHILAGSLTSVQSTGLDDGEELKYGNDGGKSGSIWDDAW